VVATAPIVATMLSSQLVMLVRPWSKKWKTLENFVLPCSIYLWWGSALLPLCLV